MDPNVPTVEKESLSLTSVAYGMPTHMPSVDNNRDGNHVDSNTITGVTARTPDNTLQAPQSRTKRLQSAAGEALFIAVVCSSQLLAQAGLALSILPQHIIARSFDIEDQPATLSWFTAGYSLTVGTFILIAGRLGDVFGHKRLFVGGAAWFGLWSALAGVAIYSSPIFFAFCRAMQGIGPAFLLANAIAILTLCYEPGRRQNMILSLFGATAPSGFLLGGVFSSLLSESAWWPWAYWVMCFACLSLAGLGILVLPSIAPTPNQGHEDSSVWQRVDIFGSCAGVASLVLFNFAWNQGPVVGWSTPYTHITLIVSILTFVVFILIEGRVRHPLVSLKTLNIESCFMLACISAGWSSFGIYTFYSLNFLEVQRGQSPLLTSAQFSPIAISGLYLGFVTETYPKQ